MTLVYSKIRKKLLKFIAEQDKKRTAQFLNTMLYHIIYHSWAQRKLSPLSLLNLLNILLSINGPLLSLVFN